MNKEKNENRRREEDGVKLKEAWKDLGTQAYSTIRSTMSSLASTIQGDQAERDQIKALQTIGGECKAWWKQLHELGPIEDWRKAFRERAAQRAARRREVEWANTIQNIYFTEGGIFSQLDRLLECFDLAEATGRDLALDVVFTILLELEYDLQKLERKLQKLEQTGVGEAEPEREEQQLLALWESAEPRMRQLKYLNTEQLRQLEEDLGTLVPRLKALQPLRPLPDYLEGSDSEALLEQLRGLAKAAELDSLGSDVASEEGKARVQRLAEQTAAYAEAHILPRWNKYP